MRFHAVSRGAFFRNWRDELAVKPKQDSDTFLREVDEELRRERVSSFVTRFGGWIIGGVIALLAVIGGWIWWQHSSNAEAGELSEKLNQVIEQLEQNNAKAAAPTIDELAGSNRDGYRIAALFARANAQISTNSIPAAIETLKGIAADESAPRPYRDAAIIRHTLLEFDTLPPDQVIERMRPFVQAGNAWHGTAGELTAAALIKQQKPAEAGRVFEGMARDRSVPETIRARAIQMASAFGIDAVQLDPAAEAAASGNIARTQAQPAATAPPANEAPKQ